jgi:DUF177 domain-containing protein
LKVDLSALEHEPLRFEEKFQLEPDRLDSEQVAGPVTVSITGEVRPHGEGYTVTGHCQGKGPLHCSRCLEAVPWTVDEEFSIEYRQALTTLLDTEIDLDEADLDISFLEGNELDLAALAAEQVFLAMPMRIVCHPDCAGLCTRCGANLNNDNDCGCEPEVDPRWSAFADLMGGSQSS